MDRFALMLEGEPGQDYVVEYVSSLAVGEPWHVLEFLRLSSPQAVVTDQNVRNNAARFYRARRAAVVPPVPQTIIDNAATTGVTRSSGWVSSTVLPGYHGTNYLHDNKRKSEFIRFTPNVASAGFYDVSLRWIHSGDRATNVPVIVHHARGTNTIALDETQPGTNWFHLGTYFFSAGTLGSIEMRSSGTATNTYVTADAVGLSIR
jgi:hypothetical protein